MVWSGKLPMKKLCVSTVVLAVAASTLAAAVKSVPVTVTVNGKSYKGGRMEHGTVVGPLGKIASDLGLNVDWDSHDRSLSITTPSPWVDVPPPIGENNHPYELTALGPIMAVRRTLDDEQLSSLKQWKDESTPVLVRYEIVNAYNMTQGAMKFEGITEQEASIYIVTAVLYWAFFKPSPGMTLGTVREVYARRPHAYESLVAGLKVLHGRIDTVNISMHPQGVRFLNTTELQKSGLAGKEVLLSGIDGWNVTGQTVESTRNVKMTMGPGGIPIYDLSVDKLRPPER